MATTHTVPVDAEALSVLVSDGSRGIFSVIGDSDGISLITGEIYASSAQPDTVIIETEHGSLRYEAGQDITLREETPATITTEQLYSLNDSLTAVLRDAFGWTGETDEESEQLNDLTHDVARLIDDLLAKSSVPAA